MGCKGIKSENKAGVQGHKVGVQGNKTGVPGVLHCRARGRGRSGERLRASPSVSGLSRRRLPAALPCLVAGSRQEGGQVGVT